MSDEILYKLAFSSSIPEDAWRTRLQWTSAFLGDQSTNFITLLTAAQLAGAAEAAPFAGRDDVMLLSFKVESMREEADLQVKYEAAESESGGSGAFVHVYGGGIPYACLHAAPATLEVADGKLVFPPMGSALGGSNEVENKGDESDTATDDGLEPFDQHRFDEDD